MSIRCKRSAGLLLAMAFVASVAAVFETNAGAAAGGHSRTFVVELKGTDTGEIRYVEGIPMMCYAVDMVDVESGQIIGTGIDCLDLTSITGGNPAAGEGFAISNTTFFNFAAGSIASRNRTTIQPVIEGSPGLTHTTTDLAVEPNVLGGTGQFDGVTGIARLGGAVDMSRFFSHNEISFNCLFVLEVSR